MIKEHELKCWPEYFQAMIDGKKSFEFRKNDRDFKAGERLRLREYRPGHMLSRYTGRHMMAVIKSVWMGLPNLSEGYCIMDILVIVPLGKEYEKTTG